MDMNGKDGNGVKSDPSASSEDQVVKGHVNGEEDSKALLPPRRGGMSRKSDKTLRKVQWNDRNGHKLVEILEFQPSDDSDSDDEDMDTCICTIM